MMKKVLYGVALTLFAGVSMGSLQSCKDDVNDLQTQTSYDLSKLRNDLNAEAARLKALIDANAANIATIQAEYAKISYVDDLCRQLEQAYKDADQALKTELENKINGAVDAINGRLDGIDGAIDGINGSINDINGSISDINGKIDRIETSITDLKAELEGAIGANTAAIDALKEYVEQNYATKQEVEEVWLQIEAVQEQMTQMMNALTTYTDEQIEEVYNQVAQKVAEIQDAINAIARQLDKQVTGLLIQGVNSPVFGDFRTPLGVQSNILFNWYGYNDRNKEIRFPSNNADFSANGDPALPSSLTPNSTWTANPGYYADKINDVTLGTVYVTVNPVGAVFDNLELFIENSAGARLPYSVKLNPSDYVLKHGYSRSEENGFYEGEVEMPLNDANVKQIEVGIEEGLTEAVKDALRDPSKSTAKALLTAVFQQLQGKLPAYALRYDWTTSEIPSITESDANFSAKAWAVLSQYDLAVATALPLGYHALYDYPGSSKQLPTFGHIQNLIDKIKELGGKMTFNFGSMTIDNVNFELGDITLGAVDTDITVDLDGAYIEIDGVQYPVEMGDDFAGVTGLEDFQSSLQSALQEAFTDVANRLNTQVNEQIIDKLNEQLEKMFDDINGQINGKIDDVLNQIDKLEPYYGKINYAIDLYNKIATKINNFLANPKAYLQVTAFYSMNGGYGIVSGLESDPTPFYGNGEAFNIFLSSYTAELIAPACKKYVAVTKVSGDDTRSLDAINKALGADFNVVLDGNRIKVPVKAAELKKDNVYEFTYQAIDYRGYTSTKKFYIKVK